MCFSPLSQRSAVMAPPRRPARSRPSAKTARDKKALGQRPSLVEAALRQNHKQSELLLNLVTNNKAPKNVIGSFGTFLASIPESLHPSLHNRFMAEATQFMIKYREESDALYRREEAETSRTPSRTPSPVVGASTVSTTASRYPSAVSGPSYQTSSQPSSSYCRPPSHYYYGSLQASYIDPIPTTIMSHEAQVAAGLNVQVIHKSLIIARCNVYILFIYPKCNVM